MWNLIVKIVKGLHLKRFLTYLVKKKVTLFLHKINHHTIPCKKSYFFLSIHFSFSSITFVCFTLEIEGVLFFWCLVSIVLHRFIIPAPIWNPSSSDLWSLPRFEIFLPLFEILAQIFNLFAPIWNPLSCPCLNLSLPRFGIPKTCPD